MIATYLAVMALVKMTKCPKCWGLGKNDDGVACKNCSGTGEIQVRVNGDTEIGTPAAEKRTKPERREASQAYSSPLYLAA
jgi:DnaJ-class molecular chaperone